MLKALALHLMTLKKRYYEVSAWTGATKVDSWIDIEGGIGNLFANASLRRQFPDLPYYVDGTASPLSKEGTFIGHHIMVPKQGIAVHKNALNFPVGTRLSQDSKATSRAGTSFSKCLPVKAERFTLGAQST